LEEKGDRWKKNNVVANGIGRVIIKERKQTRRKNEIRKALE